MRHDFVIFSDWFIRIIQGVFGMIKGVFYYLKLNKSRFTRKYSLYAYLQLNN